MSFSHEGQSNSGLEFPKATEAMASVVPGLGLGAPSKVSHSLQDFPMKVLFAN